MPGIKTGLAYIGIWLACSSIVVATTDFQNSISESSSQNSSATPAWISSVPTRRLLGFGNSDDRQDQHRFVGVHLGGGHIIQQYASIEKKKKETELSEMSGSAQKIKGQGNTVAAVIDGFKAESLNLIDRFDELTSGSNATVQELRSSFGQMSERIASIDTSLAEMVKLTNKALAPSQRMPSTDNSTRIQLDEIKSLLCSKLVFSDCWEIYQFGCNVSGIYEIRPRLKSVDSFFVYCEMDARGGGWTVFQNRMDKSISFYQGWSYYKDGFGNLHGEFWLGLESIHQLTRSKRCELLIELADSNGKTHFAVYDNFYVSSEEEKYSLQKLGRYTGDIGDSLSCHLGSKFIAWTPGVHDYASYSKGGWWFSNCSKSMLNGGWDRNRWETWSSGNIQKTRMSIRPANRGSNQFLLW